MQDYSTYTETDFLNKAHPELYGFISDPSVSINEVSERVSAIYARAEKLNCLEIYKDAADPLFEHRQFKEQWRFTDRNDLLADETFKKLFDLDPLDRPAAEAELREQAEKLKCKTQFAKKLREVEKRVKVLTVKDANSECPFFISVVGMFPDGSLEYRVSTALLAEYFRKNNRYFWLRSQSGMKPLRYLYRNGVYKSVSDDEIKSILRDYITNFKTTLLKMKDVDEAFKNLCCDSIFHDPDELDADENVINFRNGLLKLDSMELIPHTSELLSTVQLPCNWTRTPAQTPVFDSFMRDLTSGNSEVIKLLIEYMGACISNVRGSRAKKALFLVGAGNTGKSQLRLLLERLIGSEHCSSASISDLEERFGTSALMGKRLVGSPDMSAMNVKELKMFKSITGGDSIPIEFKGRDTFPYKFRGFLWNGANEMIKFGGDKGVHVYERMIIVRCENVIPEDKRDSDLLDKLYAERDGILYKLIQGLRDFIGRGYKFAIPEVCRQENEQFKTENSSVLTFYNECCCERKIAYDGCTRAKMYDVFKAWAEASGEFVPSKSKFWEELANNLTGGKVDKLFKSSKGYIYPVFTVTVETKTTYREAYGYDNVAY